MNSSSIKYWEAEGQHRGAPVGLHGGARHLQLHGQVPEEAPEAHVEVVLQKGLRAAADRHVDHTRGGRRHVKPEQKEVPQRTLSSSDSAATETHICTAIL